MSHDQPADRNLALLIDTDPATRRMLRPMLARRGLDVVQASTGIAGLELLQRLPGLFRLAVVSCDLPGLSGSAVIEAIRRFRPEVGIVCLTSADRATAAVGTDRPCLSKPVSSGDVEPQVDLALAGAGAVRNGWTSVVSEAAALRAQARFAVSGDLVESALELARGMSGEMQEEW